MKRELFDLNEIPNDLKEYFEEVEVTCGAPWRRVVEKTNPRLTDAEYSKKDATPKMMDGTGTMRNDYGTSKTGLAKPGWRELPEASTITTGWAPTCTCNAGEPIPATVLDPFNGSGTSGLVAMRLGRSYIGIDISQEYLADLAPKRMSNVQMEMVTI